jgi:hypothetical protein
LGLEPCWRMPAQQRQSVHAGSSNMPAAWVRVQAQGSAPAAVSTAATVPLRFQQLTLCVVCTGPCQCCNCQFYHPLPLFYQDWSFIRIGEQYCVLLTVCTHLQGTKVNSRGQEVPQHVRLYSIASSRYGDSGDGNTCTLCVVRVIYPRK